MAVYPHMSILHVASALDELASARATRVQATIRIAHLEFVWGLANTPTGPFVRFWASGGAKFPKMGDSLPRTPLNHRAKFGTVRFIVDGEIHKRTNKKHTNSKQYIHTFTLPIGMCGWQEAELLQRDHVTWCVSQNVISCFTSIRKSRLKRLAVTEWPWRYSRSFTYTIVLSFSCMQSRSVAIARIVLQQLCFDTQFGRISFHSAPSLTLLYYLSPCDTPTFFDGINWVLSPGQLSLLPFVGR